jgi:AcrR family transcriptional regulator
MYHRRMSETLRERTRRVVQGELLTVAQVLFVEKGYEAVTVEEIAAAAGMSKRSFFRYFASKDALVLGKYDRQGEAFVEALRARPSEEEPWVALRRMFDDVVAYVSDPEKGRRALALDRVINSSEALRAGYLERMERAQRLIADVLVDRSGRTIDRFEALALVAAAFAAMSTAHAYAADTGRGMDDALDQAMRAIRGGQL